MNSTHTHTHIPTPTHAHTHTVRNNSWPLTKHTHTRTHTHAYTPPPHTHTQCTPVYTTHLMMKSRLIQSNQHTIHSQEEPRENKESTGHHSLQQMTVKHTQAINVMVQRAMAPGHGLQTPYLESVRMLVSPPPIQECLHLCRP